MRELAEWDSFYLIVGGAAGALIGLQFVVMTLMAERPRGATSEVSSAFTTPNIIHFCAALVLSALIRVPFSRPGPLGVIWGIVGIAGTIYVVIVTRRMIRQQIYKPVVEDWLFHSILPVVAYSAIAVSAFTEGSALGETLFAVGGATLLLLLIGIHNAWDITTYNVFVLSDTGTTAAAPPPDVDES